MLLLEVLPRDRLLRITKEEAQLSKQETTKMLVRGLAHEIKNPWAAFAARRSCWPASCRKNT